MAKNAMRRNLRQSILKSLGRYIAIVGIIALGAGMFVGLRATKSDMVATGQVFTDQQNMFDLRLLSTYGWSEEQLSQIASLDGVADAEGVVTLDAVCQLQGSDKEYVYKLYSLPESVDLPYLISGRMPLSTNECLYDGFYGSDDLLGTTITVSAANNADTLDALTEHTYTIVGLVSTPLYMDMSRGNTTLGNGSLSAYVYIPRESIDLDYYTEITVTIPGDYSIYTQEYNDAMDAAVQRLEEQLLPLAQEREQAVRQEALAAYEDGLEEYEDGRTQFENGEAEALRELADARKQLEEAQAALEENRKLIEDGLAQIEEGQAQIDANRASLSRGEKELDQAEKDTYARLDAAYDELVTNRQQVIEGRAQLEDGLAQLRDGISQIDDGISQLKSGLSQLETALSMYKGLLSMAQSSVDSAQEALALAEQSGAGPLTIAALQIGLDAAVDKRDEYADQVSQMQASFDEYSRQLSALEAQRSELQAQLDQLEEQEAQLEAALIAIDEGFVEVENQRVLAESEFAAARQQIKDGRSQLNSAQAKLDASLEELSQGQIALEEGGRELAVAWEEYYAGKAKAQRELEEVRAELDDAKAQLDDAKNTIDTMEAVQLYLLDRNTNTGYLSLDSNSDIVEGISTVFPAFFLLIAALVCITTMTRMVEEERTQIGTLKALGYGNNAIIGKYLAYAGSASVIGCGLGVVIGSVVFPLILWEAYSIMMLLMPHLVLQIDWPLCLLVVGMYTAVSLLVTWYCCRMTLREVPAELIRPKPPTSGKKIFLEYLPFWNRISFLNKVTWRNIFRYRQRLLMMLVGIGGCTALLLTGFGVRDSIVDIVDIQFDEITLYDMDVRFVDAMDEEARQTFTQELGSGVGQVGFFHQSSAELDFENQAADIVLIAADANISQFMDLHTGNTALAFPGKGETLLSVGVAERLGIKEGDAILLRNSEMQTLTLTVAGIYDNHVYSYAIVSIETVEAQWGEKPEIRMACLNLAEDQDAHVLGARITEMEGVMSVSINDDIANTVGSMLEALDLVVATVVVCAGLLAVIVLYNLTNINITERIREIATIKVLGFRAGESALYVFKENLILSAMGAVIGLFGGKLLLEFVMSQIKIDMVWFNARLLPMSYVWAVVLTMVFACIVDFILYFKLEKINMAEALKSVE